MIKYTCQTCYQEFTRFWNLKRHLLAVHPVEYSHWNVLKSQASKAPSKRSDQNNSYKRQVDAQEFYTTEEVSELAWKANIYNEIRSIKNILLSLTSEVQTIRILVNNLPK